MFTLCALFGCIIPKSNNSDYLLDEGKESYYPQNKRCSDCLSQGCNSKKLSADLPLFFENRRTLIGYYKKISANQSTSTFKKQRKNQR